MKKILKKKRILFPLIFLGELAIFIIIAIIFDLETNNSLYGVIFAYILFGTFVWFLIKITKDYKTKLSTIKIPFTGIFEIPVIWGIYFVTALLIFLLIVIAPFAIMNLF